jgi:hypothetical protein
MATICVVAGAHDVEAREYWFGMTYDMGVPTQDFRKFIEDPGFIGLAAEGWSYRKPNLATGFYLGWQNFYEKTNETIQIDNATISGTQVRYTDFVSVMLGARLHFLERRNRIRPFVSAKAGTYWVKQRVEIGTLNVVLSNKWHFGLAGEGGITFLTPWLDIFGFVSAEYNYIFARDDTIDFSYLGISIGLIYIL